MKFVGKKGMTTISFPPLSFVAVGWVKSVSGIHDKHPGSATLKKYF
jgi:hypothetical protein